MRIRQLTPLMALLILIMIGLSTISAVAATNTVPSFHMDDDSRGITANDLKPSECSSMNLTSVIVVAGIGAGTNGNDLLLGSSGGDLIFGLGGDDCLVAGGGNDWLFAGGGTDVCNGGTGNDYASGCETQISIP